jgi:hypothetical protein
LTENFKPDTENKIEFRNKPFRKKLCHKNIIIIVIYPPIKKELSVGAIFHGYYLLSVGAIFHGYYLLSVGAIFHGY